MRDPIRVAILGTGQMGLGIGRLLLHKPGLALVGAYAKRQERRGLDLGTALGLGRELGIEIQTDLTAMVQQARPEVAVQTTCSRLADAEAEITALVRSGINVISIAEEMAYPAATSETTADELHRLALEHRAAVLGTGINPGFVLDLLVITLTGVCAEVESIMARRVNDLSPYGPSVLMAQGIGLTPTAFRDGLDNGSVVGHFGFRQSVHMIAHRLGWPIEHIEERREPIIARLRRKTMFAEVQPGQVAGCLHTATAYCAGKPVITLIHPQQIQPQAEGVETGDRIEIAGKPNISLAGSPEIPGGLGTAALAVNMIPRVLTAPPGLYCMADLPAPAALMGDARRYVHERGKG